MALNPRTDFEPSFLINPWRQTTHGDAVVVPSQIASARHYTPESETLGYIEVVTVDGRRITSELGWSQTSIIILKEDMRSVGVDVEDWSLDRIAADSRRRHRNK